MKIHKLILPGIFLLLMATSLKAQPWMKQPYLNKSGQEISFYDICDAFYSYWNNRPYVKGKGYVQFKRWEYFMEPKCYPDGKFPEPLRYYKEYKKFLAGTPVKAPQSWLPLGLTGWSNGISGYNPGNGRLNAVTVDMQNRDKIYVAAPSGGIWKTINGGLTWNTTFDTMPVLGTSAIAIHPADPNIIYIGTGDRDAWDTKGTGVYKSTDGGNTWHKTGLYFTATYKNFNKILINPLNPNKIFAASSDGIYRSKNGGTSWQLVYNQDNVKDLKYKPGDTTIIYGSSDYFIRSADAGNTFTRITNGIPSDTVRLEFDVSPANPNYVYAVVSKPDDTFEGVYRSVDGGLSFSARCNSPNILGYSDDGSDDAGQAWYDLAIAVSPSNANEVYVGGINVWKSVDGGATFTVNTMWYTNSPYTYIHCDIHSLNFYGDTLYCGSDGGIFYTPDQGNSWYDISNGLGISQFYRMGSSETEPYKIVAGAQDVGSNMLENGAWTHVYGADGMEAIINPNDPYTIYISYQSGGIMKSEDNGENFNGVKPYDSIRGSWVTPYVIAPDNGNNLWAGFKEVYKSTDGAFTWSQISNNLTGGENIHNLVVAESDNNYIYASRNSDLYVTVNGGNTWATYTPIPNFYISGISVDPNNPQKVWITATSSSQDRVMYSKNAGAYFSNITGNLTNMGFNCITFQKNANNALYIGTEYGVFFKDSTMSNWIAYDTDLPNVPVRELEINYAIGKIRAATYGRGIWEAPLFNQVGISENNGFQNIEIFPNPAKEHLFIKGLPDEKLSISVFNIVGFEVYRKEHNGEENVISLPVSKLVSGSYFVRISGSKHEIIRKVVVLN